MTPFGARRCGDEKSDFRIARNSLGRLPAVQLADGNIVPGVYRSGRVGAVLFGALCSLAGLYFLVRLAGLLFGILFLFAGIYYMFKNEEQ
jgi:hypothetical protein